MTPDTDVLVVGGGATGCGVARDLAMRGLDVTLVERGSLNEGTTGRSHGLLHSGARYADVDPESARACRAESRILREVAGAAVDDTGGLFLELDGDDPSYADEKLDACQACGINAVEVDPADLRRQEPALAGDLVRAIAVPDAVVFPSRLVAATMASAREHGASVRTETAVTGLAPAARAVSVELDDGSGGGPEALTAAHVVNAAGAWAGRVAALAGIEVAMAPTRGVMVTLDHAGLGTVLNRCRPPDDGDIVVPHPGAVVCGTTSEPVEDPDQPEGAEAAVETVRVACAEMVPALADAARLGKFWGVRPLHAPGGREAPRGFQLLDHDECVGVEGLTTIVGGKLTTYRLMAEAVADHVCGRLGVDEPCRTGTEPLPGHDDPGRLDAMVAELGAWGPADADVVRG